MANKKHLKVLQRGVAFWNQWRQEQRGSDMYFPDLSDADLTNADLSEADFKEVVLDGAKLTGANLSWANISDGASLTNAELIGADLMKAHLGGANLTDAKLTGADLSTAILSGTNLTRTDLTNTVMRYTTLVDVDLSTVIGLETIKHKGPSEIGIQTLYQSKGMIPEVFLRGAGVPENLLVYISSLVHKSIDFYSCFISYSSNDQEFAQRLHNDLQASGVRCWFAPENLKIGDRLRQSFDEAIRVHDKLMVILSESSVKSHWVEKEIETALEKERMQNRTVLFPISLDDVVMQTREAWAADIRRARHIGNFRDWKNHDSYRKAFDRLLRDLNMRDDAHSIAKA